MPQARQRSDADSRIQLRLLASGNFDTDAGPKRRYSKGQSDEARPGNRKNPQSHWHESVQSVRHSYTY